MPKRSNSDINESTRGPSKKVMTGIERSSDGVHLPQKRFFRQRAHINPYGSHQSYQYPIDPSRSQWELHFPILGNPDLTHKLVEIADIGCGFGGMIVSLAEEIPKKLILGMEIRSKVTEYVRLRILALRNQQKLLVDKDISSLVASKDDISIDLPRIAELNQKGVTYDNASVVKTNAMKYLPNSISKGQLSKMFFLYADPNFKPSHHRRRIINTELLAEYAYVLRPGGILYTITDVLDLHNWMDAHTAAHPSFVRLTDEELKADPCVALLYESTEEGKKVTRNHGDKYVACFRRLSDEDAAMKAGQFDFWTNVDVGYVYTPAPSQKITLKSIAKGSDSLHAEWQKVALEKAGMLPSK